MCQIPAPTQAPDNAGAGHMDFHQLRGIRRFTGSVMIIHLFSLGSIPLLYNRARIPSWTNPLSPTEPIRTPTGLILIVVSADDHGVKVLSRGVYHEPRILHCDFLLTKKMPPLFEHGLGLRGSINRTDIPPIEYVRGGGRIPFPNVFRSTRPRSATPGAKSGLLAPKEKPAVLRNVSSQHGVRSRQFTTASWSI